MAELKLKVRIIKSSIEDVPVGTIGHIRDKAHGKLFMPLDASEEFISKYPEGVDIFGSQWEIVNE